LRVDSDALSGNAVQAVFTEHLIKCVIDIEPADVTVAGPTQIVCLEVMIGHGADRRRPGDKSVLVVMATIVIEVADEGEFAGVAFPDQVLPENVCDIDLL